MANIGRSFSIAVASCDASGLLFTRSFVVDRESFAFRNVLPMFENMVDDFWLPLLPLASSLSGIEVSVRVKVVVKCPTSTDRTFECSVEDYQTLSGSLGCRRSILSLRRTNSRRKTRCGRPATTFFRRKPPRESSRTSRPCIRGFWPPGGICTHCSPPRSPRSDHQD